MNRENALDPRSETEIRELASILDEEIARLPDGQRQAVVLCFLEGQTHEEAARAIGCPLGTVKSRLAGARQKLQSRLTRRGMTPGLVVSGLAPNSALVSTCETALTELSRGLLAQSLAKAKAVSQAGSLDSSSISPSLRQLSLEVLRTMSLVSFTKIALVTLAIAAASLVPTAFLLAGRSGQHDQPRPRPNGKVNSASTGEANVANRRPTTDRYGTDFPPERLPASEPASIDKTT